MRALYKGAVYSSATPLGSPYIEISSILFSLPIPGYFIFLGPTPLATGVSAVMLQ